MMKSLQGQLLVASPKLLDPNFHQSVVLMVQHSEDGALGLVLNRPLKMTVRKAWKQISDTACEMDGFIHEGGPVEGPLMVVHTDVSLSEIEIVSGVQFSTDREAVEQLVWQCDCLAKFFVGYAGWGPGQLEEEMDEGSWLATAASAEHIFGTDDTLWFRLMKQIAEASIFWVNPKTIPEDPSLN